MYINHMGSNILNFKSNKHGIFKYHYILLFVIVFLILFLIYFLLFFKTNNKLINPTSSNISTELSQIEYVQNPLTGVFYDKKNVQWHGQRPISVMINNHIDARPQSGLENADVVYEMIAEGGITRFLAFYLSDLPNKIGPVRSTREYYLVLVKELADSMIMHIGYSPQALQAIQDWPVRSLARGGAEFYRDQERLKTVATEHTAYVDGPYLRKLGDSLGWGGVGDISVYKFKDDTPQSNKLTNGDNLESLSQSGELKYSDQISIDFWYPGDYTAIFKYNQNKNSYLRFMGYDQNNNPLPHIDNETKNQLEVKNLIVQYVAESPIQGDEKNRLTYDLVGSGKAVVFIDGIAIDSTWIKSSRDERTKFYDLKGNEIEFNKGKFWIGIVPDRNVSQVVY